MSRGGGARDCIIGDAANRTVNGEGPRVLGSQDELQLEAGDGVGVWMTCTWTPRWWGFCELSESESEAKSRSLGLAFGRITTSDREQGK